MAESRIFKSITTQELVVNKLFEQAGTLFLTFSGNTVRFEDGKNLTFNTSTGSKIGTATSQKIGFWNATPVVQQSSISDPTSDTASNNAAIDSILAVLRTIGVIAT